MDKYTIFADKLGKVCDGSGKYMKVSIKELEKGMIIDSDIFSKKGALLLYKGFKIENPDLVAIVLHRNGIDEILVKNEVPSEVVKVVESEDVKQRIAHEVRLFKEEFAQIMNEVKEDVKRFEETNDISEIKDLDKGLELAHEYENSIFTLFQMIEKIKLENQDDYAQIVETSLLAYSIGKWLYLSEKELKEISETALLSQIMEYAHFDFNQDPASVKGANSVSADILKAAFQIQERMDGSGYPKGLTRTQIHPYAKVIAVADVFQNLTTGGELAEKLSVFEAVRIMEREYITKLDVKSLYVFLHRVGSKFIGSSVRLSDGTVGEIVFVPENEVSMPYIKLEDGHVVNLQSPEYKDKHIVEIF